jgi:UDP-GlcNAc:undecaprenyl-phosphate GlcNAc-1-phosphate transferase
MPEKIFNILTIISLSSFILIFISIRFAKKFKLLDYPDKRKTHQAPTPFTGGIGISLSYVLIIYFSEFNDNYLNLILSYAFAISLVGIIDDKYHLNVGSKLIFQILPILLLIQNGLYIEDLGYFYFGSIKLGSFYLIFTILACLFLINAFNYSDGLDGFAASLFLSSIILILIITNLTLKNNDVTLFLIYLSIPVIIFLFFNFGFKFIGKCFLGNSGSLMLGFLLSFILIYLKKIYSLHPILLIWTIPIVVFDFIFTNIERIVKNKKIFKAGKDHLHYLLAEMISSNQLISLIGFLLNILIGILGIYCFLNYGAFFSLITFFSAFILYSIFRIKIKL